MHGHGSQWVVLNLPCEGTDQLIFAAIAMPELWHTTRRCSRARALGVHVGHTDHKTCIRKDSELLLRLSHAQTAACSNVAKAGHP